MRILRTLAVLALATGLSLPAGLANADGPLGGAAPAATAPAAASGPSAPGIYISPWGSAHVYLSPSTQAWIASQNITLSAIAPFVMDADGNGFDMPIGSTAGDHLDAQGRIFYPGGLVFTHPGSGTTITLKPTWIRLAPTPGYSAGVQVNGQDVSPETLIAYTTAAETLATARPTPTGFKLDKVPFHVTQEASDLFQQVTGQPGPEADSLFGTLTPRFDYVPPIF